eukprot:8564089-Karenia_brevis.AAC.1
MAESMSGLTTPFLAGLAMRQHGHMFLIIVGGFHLTQEILDLETDPWTHWLRWSSMSSANLASE